MNKSAETATGPSLNDLRLDHPILAAIGPLINHPESIKGFHGLSAHLGLIAYMVEQFARPLSEEQRRQFSLALQEIRHLENMCAAVSQSARRIAEGTVSVPPMRPQ